jgi:hypothetical protein
MTVNHTRLRDFGDATKRWLVLGGTVLLCCGSSDAASNQVFQAGACAIDITPTNFPVIINGGFLPGSAEKANDPLHARVLVLDDGDARVGLCVIDTCLIPRELADEAKRLIHEATRLPPEHILLSATHTHSAPSLMQAHGSPPDPNYPAFLLPQIVEGFRRAVRQLAPARIGWAVVLAPDYTHTRVWIRRPDRVGTDPFGARTVRANMHPGYQNPDVIGPSGPSDPELSVVSLQSPEGKPIAMLANYAQHYFGAEPVSADYYGRFAEKLRQLLAPRQADPPFVGIMSQGYSGDQQWMDYGEPQSSLSLDEYATALARLAVEACQHIRYQDWVPITMRDEDLALPVRLPDKQRLAWARGVVEQMQGRAPRTNPEIYAREQLWLEQHPVRNVKLQALRLGELGITAVSGEVFAISSLKIKAQSPLQPTLNIELANGEDGYVPPPEHHVLGSYNTWACRTACLEVNAEPKIVGALLTLLEEVAGRSRQRFSNPPGTYTQVVLQAEPMAYWRLDEISGQQALDASRHQRIALYEPGVVFYLDGPAFPAFSGLGTVNRAPHFAGGRMIAPVALPREQYSVELWFWNGLPANVRDVTGYLFGWGDWLAIGGTNRAPGRLVFSNGSPGQMLTGTSEVPLKKWNHLVLTRDGSNVVVYLNGAPDIVGEAPFPGAADVRFLYVAGREDPAETFEGKIDEVAAYDRPLGAAEVLRHFQQAGFGFTQANFPKVDPDPWGAYSYVMLNAKPLIYWRMGENGFGGRQALDSTSNGHHGVYEDEIDLYHLGPASPTFTSGHGTNHAPRFTGGRLRASNAELGQAYSVSLWFWNDRPPDRSLVTGYLFSRGPDGAQGAPGDHLGLGGTHQHQEGRLIFYNGDTLGQVLTGKTVIPAGTWNHIVLVRDTRKVEVYLNGNPQPEILGEAEMSPGAKSAEFFIGGRNDNFANFQGRIDEVAIFNRALAAAEACHLAVAALDPARTGQHQNPETNKTR